jgi:hypothetical protein
VHVEKPARVHFIPDLKVWAFVTLRAPIAVKNKSGLLKSKASRINYPYFSSITIPHSIFYLVVYVSYPVIIIKLDIIYNYRRMLHRLRAYLKSGIIAMQGDV